jgi:hypothetical protein
MSEYLDIFALEGVVVEGPLFEARPGTARAASTGGHKTATTKDGEVIDLTVWAAKYARRFQLVAALKKRAPSIFTPRVKGVKHHIRCPNTGDHITGGADVSGTFIVNAGDLSKAGLPQITSGFVIHCSHNGCAGRDRLDHIAAMLADGTLAAEDLTNERFLLPEEPPIDISGLRTRAETEAEGASVSESDKSNEGTSGSEGDKSNDWPPLVRLDNPTLPRLRGDMLPSWAGAFATSIAAATETPPELAVGMVLSACATAVARKFKVMVKYGYFEPTNLWLAVALEPGNRKSAVQKAATAALVEWERKQAECMQDEIKRATSAFKTAEARANKLRADAAKEKDGLKSTNLARQAADIEADMPQIPRPPQLWTSDVTPERLGTIMADNNEQMAWLSSEGGIFEMLGGRYSKGIPNLDLVLKAHSGDSERVDRESRPPVFLFSPSLTIGLSPQPDVLRGLSTMPGFRGRGLLARFLYLLPPSPLGYRTGKPPVSSEDIEDVFCKSLSAILDMPSAVDDAGRETTHILKLAPEAYAEWRLYAQEIEKSMRPGGELENAKDWAGKAPGAAIRIAGVLHVMTHLEPWSSKIELNNMTLALDLMAVFGKHSLAALDIMGADAGISAARKVWNWLETGHRNRLCLRDIHQALKGSFPHAKDVKLAIDVLVERGYLELTEVEAKPTGRPPSPIVIVRPDIVAGWR